MTLVEALSDFTNNYNCCVFCEYTGGPGWWGVSPCSHKNHQEVSFGNCGCPKPCNDYRLLPPDGVMRLFRDYLRRYGDFMLGKYGLYPFYGYRHPFSNFYEDAFEFEGFAFFWGEQAFAWKKAMTFKDKDTAYQILCATTPTQCKALSRRVKNYDDKIWVSLRFQVMYDIIYAKLTQKAGIRKLLMDTVGLYIYEDSPTDSVWGVGSDGLGTNLLGQIYMMIRDKFYEEEQ